MDTVDGERSSQRVRTSVLVVNDQLGVAEALRAGFPEWEFRGCGSYLSPHHTSRS